MNHPVAGVDEEELLARAYLNRVAEPGNLALWQLVAQAGARDAASAVRHGRVSAEIAQATEARRTITDPQSDLDAADRHGIALLTPDSPHWPLLAVGALGRAPAGRLRLAPPLALWAKGAIDTVDLAQLPSRAVAIVGARSATAYGARVATDFAFDLARRGIRIVSGGAYGIDAAAHRAALSASGTTVLVSAGGLDRPYPAAHAGLYERVAEEGLLLSESPPGTSPYRHRFLSRNRLIAALTAGTTVVEAALRSGALNTAAHCRAIGRPLMVVPGPVTSAMSAGCHGLLRDDGQAILVHTPDHVLQVVGSIGEGLTAQRQDSDPVRSALDELGELPRRVYEGLPARSAVTEQRLAALAGVGIGEVLQALPVLSAAGLISAAPQGYRRVPTVKVGRADL